MKVPLVIFFRAREAGGQRVFIGGLVPCLGGRGEHSRTVAHCALDGCVDCINP